MSLPFPTTLSHDRVLVLTIYIVAKCMQADLWLSIFTILTLSDKIIAQFEGILG